MGGGGGRVVVCLIRTRLLGGAHPQSGLLAVILLLLNVPHVGHIVRQVVLLIPFKKTDITDSFYRNLLCSYPDSVILELSGPALAPASPGSGLFRQVWMSKFTIT